MARSLESLFSGIEGFLGLRFPATDVPANARRLYLLIWQRAIADVYSETVPILTTPNSEPIDFTYSQLRAVHPAHIQYLKNIGTVASFSVSIVVAGKLWGLIACHYFAGKIISLAQRQLCEQLSRMTSIHMSDMNAIEIEKSRSAYREAQAEVRGHSGHRIQISARSVRNWLKFARFSSRRASGLILTIRIIIVATFRTTSGLAY